MPNGTSVPNPEADSPAWPPSSVTPRLQSSVFSAATYTQGVLAESAIGTLGMSLSGILWSGTIDSCGGGLATAEVGGVAGPVSTAGSLPGGGDAYVDAHEPGELGRRELGGELEERGERAWPGLIPSLRMRAVIWKALIGRPGCPPGNSQDEVPWSPSTAWPQRGAMSSRTRVSSGWGRTVGSRPSRTLTSSPVVSLCSRVSRLILAGPWAQRSTSNAATQSAALMVSSWSS